MSTEEKTAHRALVAENVRDDGLVATLFTPQSGKDRYPGILALSGSEGGIPERFAKPLAAHGYAVLALAYFQASGLPDELSKIPLETIQRAILWMKRHRAIDTSHLAVTGASKGGELSLLAASRFPEIKGVVAYVPSSVVWQAISASWTLPPASSWTWSGQELPYVHYKYNPEFITQAQSGKPLRLDLLYGPSLEQADQVAAAVIPVENINGPVLLITGSDDHMWPSSLMARMVMQRLASHQHAHQDLHLDYPGAGHLVGIPAKGTPSGIIDFGGTLEANQKSFEDSWPKVLSFYRALTNPDPQASR